MIKLIIIATWILIVFNLFMPFGGVFGQILSWLGPILLLAHLVEFFLFKEKIKAKGDETGKAFIMTMIFGVAYFAG